MATRKYRKNKRKNKKQSRRKYISSRYRKVTGGEHRDFIQSDIIKDQNGWHFKPPEPEQNNIYTDQRDGNNYVFHKKIAEIYNNDGQQRTRNAYTFLKVTKISENDIISEGNTIVKYDNNLTDSNFLANLVTKKYYIDNLDFINKKKEELAKKTETSS